MGITDRTLKPVRPLVRPSPLKGESLRGYLLRVGDCNGYGEGINLYMTLTGTQGTSCKVFESALENVARSLGLTSSQVDSIAYRKKDHKSGPGIDVFGHIVSLSHLRVRHPAVCPECLSDLNAVSGLWDLNAVCACPTHGRWLIDVCPCCREPLRWMRKHVAFCNCGFDLRKSRARKASEGVLAFTSLLHELVLGDLPIFREKSLKFPEALRHSPLREILALVRYAASVLAPRHGVVAGSCKTGSPKLLNNSKAVVLTARLLQNWPDQLPEVLAAGSKKCADRSRAKAVLTHEEFRQQYSKVMDPAVHCRSLATQVPEFFSEEILHFRGEYCVGDPQHGRYLNPALTWCLKDGRRVLRRNTMLAVLRQKREAKNPVVPFAEFIEEKRKGEVFRSPMVEMPFRPDHMKLAWERFERSMQALANNPPRRRRAKS